jgi:hypothetical protein
MARRVGFLACAAGFGIASDRPAQACGGCFHPPPVPSEVTVVTDHRMAFSMSTSQSVLWDQIEYSGSPKDFSWVLPVKTGTVVQLSSDQWFSALDAMTAPTINPPIRPCSNGSGAACAGSASNGSASYNEAAGTGGVQVINQSVVGPYDTATLRATDPNALENWLTANGYVLPDAMKPTVNAYVAGGFDFIALRLQPGQGVQAMQPVRVVTQGADPSLPLRMVAAGVGAQVGVTLYVVSEGRYEVAPPFSNATIDDSKLVWNHTQNLSNYQDLAHTIMQQDGGRTWLTEYSLPLQMNLGDAVNCTQQSTNTYYMQSLSEIYLGQCCPVTGLGLAFSSSSGGSTGLLGPYDAAQTTQNDAANEAGDDASETGQGEAGDIEAAAIEAAPGDAAAGQDASTGSRGVDGGMSKCTGDDLEVAVTGLHASSIWVTRLRALIPANALSEHDLVLRASSTQSTVSNIHNTNTYDDPAYSPCGNTGGGGCAASASDPRGTTPWLEGGALCLLAATGWRRKRFSGRSSLR